MVSFSRDPINNPVSEQVKNAVATANLADLVMPSVSSTKEAMTFVQDFIRGQNPQAGTLADMLPTASPMAATALNARIGQLAGGVGVLALAFGALRSLMDQDASQS